MITFTYQGREIQAERTNEMNGCLLIATRGNWSLQHDGEEALYRDQAGQYYLRRQLKLLDLDGDTQRHASQRVQVRRLSLTAAVQWAITRCNADSHALRNDATRALHASRGYLSPENPDEVTVPLTLPVDLYRQVLAMAAYDDCKIFGSVVQVCLSGDVRAWLEGDGNCQPTPRQFLRRYEKALDAGKHPEVWPPLAFPPAALTADQSVNRASLLMTFDLPPLFGALLRAFERRHGIGAAALARASLCHSLEEIFDHPFNGGEIERDWAEGIRAHGYINAPDEKQTAVLLRAAGLTAADLHHAPVLSPEASTVNDLAAFAWLDDYAAELLGAEMAQRPDLDPRDLINGALRFLLEEGDKADTGRKAVEEATRYRQEDNQKPLSPLDPPASKDDQPGEEPSVLDHLNTEAGLAVLRYLHKAPWDYRSREVVSACVCYALQQVFDALEQDCKGVVPEGEYYRENAWGWLEERIDRFTQQRNGGQPIGLKAGSERVALTAADGTSWAELTLTAKQRASIECYGQACGLEFEAALQKLLGEGIKAEWAMRWRDAAAAEDADAPLVIEDLRGLPAAADRPDLALCAAASVPPVDETTQPLRPLLMALAQDWQAKAGVARAQEPPPRLDADAGQASQADVLEGCAGALLRALDGKEGR